MASGPIGVAVIGMGNSGWYYHADGTLRDSPDYELVTVCDANAAQAQRAGAAFGVRAQTDWREVAADDAVELVIVALPHHLHHEVAVGCSRAGKHVVVEKPMATSVADAQEMLETARAAGRVLAVFHQRRWDADFRAIRSAVDAGEIATMWRMETRRSNSGVYVVVGDGSPHSGSDVAEWAYRRDGGGGVVFLASPHLVDHLLCLAGRPPISVAARSHANGEVEDYVEIVVDFGDGLTGRAEVCPSAPVNPPKWAVYGTGGAIASRDGREVVVAPTDGSRRVLSDLPPLRHCDEFYAELARSIREGAPPPVDPAEGLRVIAVLEAARESAAMGGVPVALGEV